jgi:Flp pilus assembly pilin Flp
MYNINYSGQPADAVVASESGASAVEYAILVSLIAGVLIAIITTVGLQVFGTFDCVVEALGTFPSLPSCLP